ncbi:MAG TPA: hypothetical protein PLB32_10210 [Acidobacteriota bacterium]|nr:hypothetical protein [Acidobacteriota bacterium]
MRYIKTNPAQTFIAYDVLDTSDISQELNVRLCSLSLWLRIWKPDWVLPFPDGTHFKLLFFNE